MVGELQWRFQRHLHADVAAVGTEPERHDQGFWAKRRAHKYQRDRPRRLYPLRHRRLKINHLLGLGLRQLHVRHLDDEGRRPILGRRLLEGLQVVLNDGHRPLGALFAVYGLGFPLTSDRPKPGRSASGPTVK